LSPQADVRAINLEVVGGGTTYDVAIADAQADSTRTIERLHLPMLGEHNVQNSLAAIAVADQMGIPDEDIRRALAAFAGVKRRFTRTGTAGGIAVIDDYGHHPVEIAAVLKAARSATSGKVIAVVQPHRYSRLANLFEDFCTCFNDADRVLVADVYAAGEEPIVGADRDSLVEGLRAHGHRYAAPLPSPAELPRLVAEMAEPGDLVVCLGAGSITNWANALPADLERLWAKREGRA
jgi:UDP-N-acetylmuramate--alanine ligase